MSGTWLWSIGPVQSDIRGSAYVHMRKGCPEAAHHSPPSDRATYTYLHTVCTGHGNDNGGLPDVDDARPVSDRHALNAPLCGRPLAHLHTGLASCQLSTLGCTLEADAVTGTHLSQLRDRHRYVCFVFQSNNLFPIEYVPCRSYEARCGPCMGTAGCIHACTSIPASRGHKFCVYIHVCKLRICHLHRHPPQSRCTAKYQAGLQ